MTTQIKPLPQAETPPYEIGRFSGGWKLLILLLVLLVGVGAFAYAQQLAQGEVATGMRNIGTMGGATWGLYITFVVYFVGVSFAGITLAALIRLLNLHRLQPVARMAEVMTVVALILGAFSIVADVGQPARAIVNLLRYVRPGSPFFGTFTIVITGYLFASLVYLYLDGRRCAAFLAKKGGRLSGFYRWWAAGYQDTPVERARHQKTSFWLAIALIPLLITATSTLGFVFGLQAGRPGWFGALQAPGFVVMATISGLGMLILIAAALRRTLNLEGHLNQYIFRTLGNALMIMVAIYLYFIVAETLTTTYAAHGKELELAQALLAGEYAPIFWLVAICLLVPLGLLLWQYVRSGYSLPIIVLSGLLVNVAAVGRRYLIVVPSQTHGMLLPYPNGSYIPSWVETGIIVGLFAFGALLYLLFVKLFPIVEMGEPIQERYTEPANQDTARRRAIAILMVVAGFGLQIFTYFFLAAPLGLATGPVYSEPRLPFASLLFILGVMLVFLAAVVYELLPEKESA